MEEYCLNEFFDYVGETIKIYTAKETIEDPYEKNVSLTRLNSLPVKAIVTDLIASQVNWKMPGIVTNKAKELIIKKKYRSLLEKSEVIEVRSELYEGWRINRAMQIREEGDFLRVYIYIRKVTNG